LPKSTKRILKIFLKKFKKNFFELKILFFKKKQQQQQQQ